MDAGISGWFNQLEDGDVARLMIADRDRPGALAGHLGGKCPVFGVPPVGTASETADYLQRRAMLRAVQEMTAATSRMQRRQAILDAAAPGEPVDTPRVSHYAPQELDEPTIATTLH